MLTIINYLKPFFEDCYRRINVREYARIVGVSPPTASTILSSFWHEKLLIKDRYRKYILFYANKESVNFINLSRIYWSHRLYELLSLMEKKLTNPTIILFGSLSKAEAKKDSDVDLAVFAHKKELDVKVFENKLKRRLQIYWFRSIKDIESKELANNIINGHILKGRLSL